ncbi:hypothetical protein ASPZODRAFT_29359 [Penicilliopsis zonata CBS 506.65]|uniref:Uncharacterized protein n=1 Tax=Penicilliopsis zonata CBS 506.65 TaxID=1073090 RepID=A0A1L9S4Y8_9EURO|nr:hypothetical protein ASPZODRAFT_29359 [Penicilliopsis zonata CBS 506.65]OJJ42229.1 hypothetical protein ASPZODRAFT_29359 [Penicilliopsis zonata CBS 506.65]
MADPDVVPAHPPVKRRPPKLNRKPPSATRDSETDELESVAEEERGVPRGARRLARGAPDRPGAGEALQQRSDWRGQAEQQLVPLPDVSKAVDEATDLVQDVTTKAVGAVGDTTGKLLRGVAGGSQMEPKQKEEQLRLRLDLNLDVEVQLKAKIHGDLTLQLLN